ncbi:MAG TPA: hypothetical protein VNR11_05725 [Xanthobacteraceae bacterium]|nr:hypothetical protein [Xanthobacteraceae bacterium]
MVPKVSEARRQAGDETTREANSSPQRGDDGDDDVILGLSDDLGRRSGRQLRYWLLVANIIAWILIALVVRALFF